MRMPFVHSLNTVASSSIQPGFDQYMPVVKLCFDTDSLCWYLIQFDNFTPKKGHQTNNSQNFCHQWLAYLQFLIKGYLGLTLGTVLRNHFLGIYRMPEVFNSWGTWIINLYRNCLSEVGFEPAPSLTDQISRELWSPLVPPYKCDYRLFRRGKVSEKM